MSAGDTLERRARQLATPIESIATPSGAEYIVFHVNGERYALESSHVSRVERIPAPTPIPGVPTCFLGAITLQGDIIPVASLRELLDLPRVESSFGFAIVLDGRGAPLAIAADELGDLALLAAADGNVNHHRLIRGVTHDAVVLLDAERILEDPRLVPDLTPATIHQENAS